MKKRNSAFNRTFTVLVFLFLYLPIFLLIVFSFNEGNSNTVWTGFSLHWYKELFPSLKEKMISSRIGAYRKMNTRAVKTLLNVEFLFFTASPPVPRPHRSDS